MSLEFDSYEIRDICDINNSSYSPKESWSFFNYLDTKNITKGKIDEIKYLDPLEDIVPSRAKRKVNNKDIIYSTVRPNQEHYGLIENQPKNFLVSTGFTTLKVNTEKAIPEYVYYFITQNHITESLQTIAEQSTTSYPSIRPSDIGDLIIPLPPLHIQYKISSILRNIDIKIKLNEQINHNLETIIKKIYNNWFEDFEPFKNEEFFDTKLGKIPVGWKLEPLQNFIKFQEGPGIRNWQYVEENGVNFLNIRCIQDNDLLLDTANMISKEEAEGKYSHFMLNEWDIVISSSGTLGRYAIVRKEHLPLCLNTSIIRFAPKHSFNHYSYVYSYLTSRGFYHYLLTMGSGSVQLNFGPTHLKQIDLIVPPDDVLKEYNDLIFPLIEKMKSLKSEIDQLIKLRDTLLPKLMSGAIDVSKINCDLKLYFIKFILKSIIQIWRYFNMKTKLISKIQNQMKPFLNQGQYLKLTNSLLNSFKDVEILDNNNDSNETDNFKLLNSFLSAKQVEGRSEKTIVYYKSTLEKMLAKVNKQVYNITTDDIRKYLFEHKQEKDSSKITIDNMRRIFSSFFSWLEDEDYILKNPVRRIHRVKTGRVVKEVLTDENLEVLRDNCEEIRDLAIVEILISTGIRVGELVKLNIEDINFYERECVVFGNGESERVVYFDARTKIHLLEYLESRTDENPALFVSLNKPHERLGINGVETRLRELGNKCNIPKVHPHKFRRTLATNAIDKGMPIEQVQKLLGHVQIDTTMQYAMVNQSNVKIAHRKFIS